MQLNLDLGIKMAVHHERHIEGKKMGLFFSHSKKGPVFEHFRKYGTVTKFVLLLYYELPLFRLVLRQISVVDLIKGTLTITDCLTFMNFAG